MIALHQVTKMYPLNNRTFYALQDINLSIQAGEIVGIIGKSGAGKSTLLRSINLLEKPSKGHIYINDVDITMVSINELKRQRQRIGMIFQHFNLLQSRTAFDNIALPLELLGEKKDKIKERVSSLLELVHLSDRYNHYPSQLSGGQKQRVAIARALATYPNILLCDEPTSALDSKSTFSILNLLKEINKKLGVTILIITHETNVIKYICDYAGVLDQGRLIEYATTIELLTRPKSIITRQLLQTSMHGDIL
ncbi:MAG: ATP-binding cassette domain-containing protein [Gammaproteobacteria bacterium]|nr:MAG: ATP-binding cassette domain-containing protein [Gammaproteobacteria bacterium]